MLLCRVIAKRDQREAKQRGSRHQTERNLLSRADAAFATYVEHIYGKDSDKTQHATDEQQQAEVSLGEGEMIAEHSGRV